MPAPTPTLLVIDDEAEVLDMLAEMLTSQGHKVLPASGGREGLARLEAGEPVDLVLTDLGMPGMTGWEVARAVKVRWPHLPVGLVTGWGEVPEALPEERRWVDFVLAKPVTLEALREATARIHPKSPAP
jgi:CheY-like chemotaxis protein